MVSFVPPVTLEILNCLVASEHLSLRELLDLRLLCAQIKQWLTGNLPKYLQHRLTGSGSASAADQVHRLVELAGARNVCQLHTLQHLLPHLSIFQSLKTLHLDIRDPQLDTAERSGATLSYEMIGLFTLTTLQQLQSLNVDATGGPPVLLAGIHELAVLRFLDLTCAYPVGLPLSLTDLSVRLPDLPCFILDFSLNFSLSEYKGTLEFLTLPMRVITNDPCDLEVKFACVRQVRILQLTYDAISEGVLSDWTPRMPQLQILHIFFCEVSAPVQLKWDLAGCTGLKEFWLTLNDIRSGHLMLDLSRVRNVHADMFQMHLGPCTTGLTLDCSSWQLAQANIRCPVGCLTALWRLVCRIMIALQHDTGLPFIMVNGISPLKAAVADAEKAPDPAIVALYESLSDDEE